MNHAVSKVKTDWFTFVEVDDEMSKIWVKNFLKYKKAYPEVDLFLPIVVERVDLVQEMFIAVRAGARNFVQRQLHHDRR